MGKNIPLPAAPFQRPAPLGSQRVMMPVTVQNFLRSLFVATSLLHMNLTSLFKPFSKRRLTFSKVLFFFVSMPSSATRRCLLAAFLIVKVESSVFLIITIFPLSYLTCYIKFTSSTTSTYLFYIYNTRCVIHKSHIPLTIIL